MKVNSDYVPVSRDELKSIVLSLHSTFGLVTESNIGSTGYKELLYIKDYDWDYVPTKVYMKIITNREHDRDYPILTLRWKLNSRHGEFYWYFGETSV